MLAIINENYFCTFFVQRGGGGVVEGFTNIFLGKNKAMNQILHLDLLNHMVQNFSSVGPTEAKILRKGGNFPCMSLPNPHKESISN